MKPLTDVIARAQLISPDALREFQRWGTPSASPPAELFLDDPTLIVEAIHEALESGDLVEMRTTDLDTIRSWRSSFTDVSPPLDGRLFLKNGDTSNWGKCSYVVSASGELVFPWNGDDITDLLVNGECYLVLADRTKVYFESARELFYGDTKAFVACMPRKM